MSCRGNGICRCLIQYDDGTVLPGSGSSNDPYIIPKPPFSCIVGPDGSILEPNAAGCVRLPQIVTCILTSEGELITPDEDGCITIPSSDCIRSFFIEDEVNGRILVSDNSTVTFALDPTFTRDKIEIVGETVFFPRLKTEEFRRSNVQVQIPANGRAVVGQVDLSHLSPTQFFIQSIVDIEQVTGATAPNPNEYIQFDVCLDGGSQGTILLSEGYRWYPNMGNGYRQVNGLAAPYATTGTSPDIYDLVIKNIDSSTTNRQIEASAFVVTTERI